MKQEYIGNTNSKIEHIAYGEDTNMEPITLDGVEHIPYVAQMSNQKIHIYFAPNGLASTEQSETTLKERALLKIDPRITYSQDDTHTTFHGFLTTPEYRNGKFSQPAFDWLVQYCDETNKPLTDTTSINKPTIALFLQRQAISYGFKPDSVDAIAEILNPDDKYGIPRIRWLYNILPIEDRVCKKKTYTFYEVEGDNGIITRQKRVLDIGHHVVAMHTIFSR